MKKKTVLKISLIVLLVLFVSFWVIAFVKVCPRYGTYDISVPFYPYEETVYDKIFDKACPVLLKLTPLSFIREVIAIGLFDTDLENLDNGFPSLELIEAYKKIDIFQAWDVVNNELPQLSSVSIGILDTGIDASNGKHPEFESVNFGSSPPSFTG